MGVCIKNEGISNEDKEMWKLPPSKMEVGQTFLWRNIPVFTITHTIAIFGFYRVLINEASMWQTTTFSFACGWLGGLGTTAGSHRLWAHQAYKAKMPLKLLLVFMQTLAGQDSILIWVRDHRLHHKFTDTEADPHNSNRGFIFSQIGWLVTKKNDLVMEKLKCIDMSDLEADPVLMFQYKYYFPLAFVTTFIIPLAIPFYLWDEQPINCICALCIRYFMNVQITSLVNSAAHLWGSRPYDKNINPTENKLVALLAFGEGWHNYHHVFPWDYKASEFGNFRYNATTLFINFFALIGWAYDLKTVKQSMVAQRARRTGDGSLNYGSSDTDNNNNNNNDVIKGGNDHEHLQDAPWGWEDKRVSKADREITDTLYAAKAKYMIKRWELTQLHRAEKMVTTKAWVVLGIRNNYM